MIYSIKLFIILVLTICISSCNMTQENSSSSQNQTISHYNSQVRAFTPGKIKQPKHLAIFLSCDNKIVKRMLEDFISVCLLEKGFKILPRTKLERLMAKELNKEEWGVDANREKTILDIIKLGKLAKLDTVITGTIIDSKKSLSIVNEKKQTQSIKEGIAVSSIYVQLIDVQTEEVMMGAVGKYKMGKNIPDTATDIVELLKRKMVR